jgi:DNA-binding CsgD family transcriptional regulator
VPIAWNQETYTSVGEGERWELQASFGYRAGIALATHLPGGGHFFVGVDRDQALPGCSSEVSRLAADLSLFVMHAQDVALRVLMPEASSRADVPTLTSRELESLRWTMEGKTAWEVGRILGISEQTAVRHFNNATHKLGCVNKLQAVLKAFRMELIR